MKTLSIIASFLVSVLLIYSIAVLLFRDWKDRVHLAYSFIAITGFGIIFSMFLQYAFPGTPYLTGINRITQASFVSFSGGLVVMSFIYPVRGTKIRFRNIILIMLPAFIISYFALFTELNIKKAYFEGETLIRDFGPTYTAYMIISALYLFWAAGNYIRRYFKSGIEIYRIQLRYVFISSSAVIIAVVFSVVMPRFYNYTEFYVLGPSIAAFSCVGAFFYGIVSFDMMDITTVIRRAAIYLFISLAIIIPMYGLIQLYYMNIAIFEKFPKYLIEVSLVVLFILFSIYIQPAIYRLFEIRRYKFEAVLDKFAADIVGEIRDPRGMIEKSVDILFDTLDLKNASFLEYNLNEKKFDMYYSRGDQEDSSFTGDVTPVVNWFLDNDNILQLNRLYTDEKSFSESRDVFLEFFNKYGIKIILPVYHRNGVLGLFGLGEKVSQSGYKLYEVMKLETFRREINIHISNAFTYKEAMRDELLQRTLDLSTDILSKSVPISIPGVVGVKFGAFYVPKYRDRMDYFDFLKVGTQGVGVIATDMPGIGFDDPFHSVIMRSAFQTSISEAPSSYSIMQRLNRVLCDYHKGLSAEVKSCYFYYDIKSQRLVYTNAGFPPLEIFRVELNGFEQMDTDGAPLGADPAASYGMGRTNMLRGDIGVLYSTALTNTKNQDGEIFGLTRLQNIVREYRMSDSSVITQNVRENYISFMGDTVPESSVILIVFKVG